jgi:hypothetical protein
VGHSAPGSTVVGTLARMSIDPGAELFHRVESNYTHYAKRARPVTAATGDGVFLKWYSLAVPERAHTDDEITAAQSHVLGEIAAGRLALTGEVGFVVQHRVATMDVFYVCSWNGNNELWETHYFKPLDSDDYAVGDHGTKFPTFCVWVLAIVQHETAAWSRYLTSSRDGVARVAYCTDQIDATVS